MKCSYKKKWCKRAINLALALCISALGLIIIFKTFNENIIFFLTTSELKQNIQHHSKTVRLGGVVKSHSIKTNPQDNVVFFVMTDYVNEIKVRYSGAIPSLFQEESGAVVKGQYINDIFIAEELLAKHDENYMPKDVATQLKKEGRWKQQ